MKRCVFSLFFLVLVVFSTGAQSIGVQEESPSDEVVSTRHILRFSISKFDQVSEKSEILELNNEEQSLEIVNQFKELTPTEGKMVGKVHDLPSNATSKQFFEALRKIEEEIKASDELVIYISSHGYECIKSSKYRFGDKDQGDSLYIVTNEPMENWVPVVEVTKYLSRTKLRPSRKLLIVNCSRSYVNRTSGYVNIGKHWENNEQTSELDSNGRVIVNSTMVALEDGRTDLDLNMAMIFACSGGLEAYEIGNTRKGLFEKVLSDTLSGGPSGYVSVEGLFEKVRTRTERMAVRVKGKPQVPAMVVFAQDAESFFAISKQWKVGISDRPETDEKLINYDKDLAVKERTIEDAIGKKANNLSTKDWQKIFYFNDSIVKKMGEINYNKINMKTSADGIKKALKIINQPIVKRVIPPNVSPFVRSVMEAAAKQKEMNLRAEKKREQEKVIGILKQLTMDLKRENDNLENNIQIMGSLINNIKMIDITNLLKENKELRSQLGVGVLDQDDN